MFRIDDYVYYASGGVCLVSDICYAPLSGMSPDRQYYVLQSVHGAGGVMYVPVDSESVFLRRLLTKEEAEALLKKIPDIEGFDEPSAKALRQRYLEAMRRHDPEEWVRVIKTAHGRMQKLAARSNSGRISDTERSYAEDAKRYLYGELSITLEVPLEDLRDFLRRQIELSV